MSAPREPATHWQVGPLRPGDRDAWEQLYRGYGAFYETQMPPAKLDLVWGWLHDDTHELTGLAIRREPDDPPVGLAHYRPFSRPLHGATGLFLDDLFVSPGARGGGAADRLLAELRSIAAANGWDVVRWLTSGSNDRARRVYDRVAQASEFVTYNMRPAGD